LEDNFSFQPDNGLLIKTWINDPHDTNLISLEKMLEDMYNLKPKDIREILKLVKEEADKKAHIINPYAKINIGTLLKS